MPPLSFSRLSFNDRLHSRSLGPREFPALRPCTLSLASHSADTVFPMDLSQFHFGLIWFCSRDAPRVVLRPGMY